MTLFRRFSPTILFLPLVGEGTRRVMRVKELLLGVKASLPGLIFSEEDWLIIDTRACRFTGVLQTWTLVEMKRGQLRIDQMLQLLQLMILNR